MNYEWLFATLHLIALAVGFGAIVWRAIMLRLPNLASDDLKRVFNADAIWGMAALLWLVSGLPRAFLDMGKGNEYYLHNGYFHVKMGLFILIVLLEIAPMIALIKWRIAMKRGQTIDLSPARKYSNISALQAALLIVMIGLATAMARGLGM